MAKFKKMEKAKKYDLEFLKDFWTFLSPLFEHATVIKNIGGKGNCMTQGFRNKLKDWSKVIDTINSLCEKNGVLLRDIDDEKSNNENETTDYEMQDMSKIRKQKKKKKKLTQKKRKKKKQKTKKNKRNKKKENMEDLEPSDENPIEKYKSHLKTSQEAIRRQGLSHLTCVSEYCHLKAIKESEISWMTRNAENEHESNKGCCTRLSGAWRHPKQITMYENETIVIHQRPDDDDDDDAPRLVTMCLDEHVLHKVCIIMCTIFRISFSSVQETQGQDHIPTEKQYYIHKSPFSNIGTICNQRYCKPRTQCGSIDDKTIEEHHVHEYGIDIEMPHEHIINELIANVTRNDVGDKQTMIPVRFIKYVKKIPLDRCMSSDTSTIVICCLCLWK